MDKTKKKKISDDRLKLYITCMAVVISILLLLINKFELMVLVLFTFELWIGYKMCIKDESGDYHCDTVSMLCCVSFNTLLILFYTAIDFASGQSTSLEGVFIYILTVFVSVIVGYCFGKKKPREKFEWTDMDDEIESNGEKMSREYRRYRKEFEEKYGAYSDIHSDSNKKDTYQDNYNNYGTESDTSSNNDTESRKVNSNLYQDYFKNCKTKKEIKKRYRELSKKYHPDTKETGNNAIFMELKTQYEKLMK